MRPCKNTLFLGCVLQNIHISFNSGNDLFTSLSTSSVLTASFTISSLFSSSPSFFLTFLGLETSKSSDNILHSEIFRFLFKSSLLVEAASSKCGRATLSKFSWPNSWLEPSPESWEKPFRYVSNTFNFFDGRDVSLLLFDFFCRLGRGGKDSLRSCRVKL